MKTLILSIAAVLALANVVAACPYGVRAVGYGYYAAPAVAAPVVQAAAAPCPAVVPVLGLSGGYAAGYAAPAVAVRRVAVVQHYAAPVVAVRRVALVGHVAPAVAVRRVAVVGGGLVRQAVAFAGGVVRRVLGAPAVRQRVIIRR